MELNGPTNIRQRHSPLLRTSSVSSFLLTLRNGLVRYREPASGVKPSCSRERDTLSGGNSQQPLPVWYLAANFSIMQHYSYKIDTEAYTKLLY